MPGPGAGQCSASEESVSTTGPQPIIIVPMNEKATTSSKEIAYKPTWGNYVAGIIVNETATASVVLPEVGVAKRRACHLTFTSATYRNSTAGVPTPTVNNSAHVQHSRKLHLQKRIRCNCQHCIKRTLLPVI